MGPPLPEKLTGTAATLGALSILTMVLRCWVRIRIIKQWGWDDSTMVVAFIMHMWYTITLLTGIHYGTGRRTSEISLTDSFHAMRCWYLCFLAFACTITLAKISAGFFFLRLTSTITLHRIAIYIVTILTALVGFSYFFLSVFQCRPIEYFWTRLAGAEGSCVDMEVIIGMSYLYGTVASLTDITFGLLVGILVWRLNIDKREKLLITPLLGMACVASYAAIVRMPYIKDFKSADFLYGTVEISLWSTVEVGVSIVAANFATLRPLCRVVAEKARSLSSRFGSQPDSGHQQSNHDLGVLAVMPKEKSDIEFGIVDLDGTQAPNTPVDGDSMVSLTRSSRQKN